MPGIVAVMVPVAVVMDTGPPMTVGVAANVPVGPDNCTLNWLVVLNDVPEVEKGTEIVAAVPAQMFAGLIVPVVIDWANPLLNRPMVRNKNKARKQFV